MCGKFTHLRGWKDVVAYADLLTAEDGEVETVTPMRLARVITLDEEGARKAVPMRWGMVAHNARDPMSGSKHIHARAETLDTLPTFRDAFAHRRGLIALSTFNEAKEIGPSKREQQVITPKDGKPLAVTVVWERWTHHNKGELLTFAMVTVPANRLISSVTDRMPAFLAPEDWSKWLGEEPASPEEIKALLKTIEADWEMKPQTKTPPPARPDQQSELF